MVDARDAEIGARLRELAEQRIGRKLASEQERFEARLAAIVGTPPDVGTSNVLSFETAHQERVIDGILSNIRAASDGTYEADIPSDSEPDDKPTETEPDLANSRELPDAVPEPPEAGVSADLPHEPRSETPNHRAAGDPDLFNDFERLPIIELVADRLALQMSTTLTTFNTVTTEVCIDQISSVRLWNYLNLVLPPLPMYAVLRADPWDDYCLMLVDNTLAYSVVDTLLGGCRDDQPFRKYFHRFTAIDTNLIGRMIEAILDDLSDAFAPFAPVRFRLIRVVRNPRLAVIAPPDSRMVRMIFRVDMNTRGGRLELALPFRALDGIKSELYPSAKNTVVP